MLFRSLNNDTIVGAGWTRGLRRHFEADPGLGLICPVTNNIGNEAQVALPGRNPQEVFISARRYNFQRSGRLLPLPNVAFFCVMMPRRVYEAVGPMDEQFVPGFFEDDDYCLRVRDKGWTIGCAEDVFVYHELSASFDAEGAAFREDLLGRYTSEGHAQGPTAAVDGWHAQREARACLDGKRHVDLERGIVGREWGEAAGGEAVQRIDRERREQ